MPDYEGQWKAKRAALTAAHDDGAHEALCDALADNRTVECMAYCYGGTPVVAVNEVLADLAEAGWRLVAPPEGTEARDA